MNNETLGVGIGRQLGDLVYVSVEVRTDEPERRFAPGQVLRDEGGTQPFTVQSVRDHSGRLLVRFAEVINRETAEAVRGTLLIAAVEPDERPLEPEEFYDRQLIGLQVRRPDGVVVGTVNSVLHLPSQEVLEVETANGPRLIPFVTALVPHIDLEACCLTVADVAGLLDDLQDVDED